MDAFLSNPMSLFDIKGRTALITGASGAFGALAAKVLAGAGANVQSQDVATSRCLLQRHLQAQERTVSGAAIVAGHHMHLGLGESMGSMFRQETGSETTS